MDKAKLWLESPVMDDDSRSEIKSLMEKEDSTELVDAFYQDLAFGTGGLRGIMGVGSNRMNRYTVGKATQGLSNFLKKTYLGQSIKVAVAYDSRNNNKFFADVTASVLTSNGIEVYLFEDLRPTPELSFAVRHLGCQGGIVITASHNPKEYNGYKVYGNDGAQVVAPHDQQIMDEVNSISSLSEIKFDKDESKVHILGEEIDRAYLEQVKTLSLSGEEIARQKDLKIVFTPIHGTGITLVPKALEAVGFENIHVVEEQAEPDGNFSTVPYPNPEERAAMKLGLERAQAIDADILFATDPDADRIGVGLKNNKGEWELLNGNQTAALLTYYLINRWKELGKLTGKEYIVYTIVTSDILGKIAEAYDVEHSTTLTGFKFIAEVIRELEGKKTFIGGGEESYGFLVGDFVRDKDAVSACLMFAEMTAYYKDKGLSIFDMLEEMYRKFGFYYEELVSLTEKGKAGQEAIQKRMKDMREKPFEVLNGEKVVEFIDYKSGELKNLQTGENQKLAYPSSNVLQFITESGTKVSVRPSGTEPKIKFYFSVNSEFEQSSSFEDKLDSLKVKIKDLKSDMNL
ncbi:phosphoglucomutase [Aureibacter tunicatorum]|uniref:Phosphoglucomutase n=2 Tax=Aureibacter tunicatorum TaxID=866807 RepID=A0AAE4BQU8_9BACT|nr:phosphoglucomutase [Aureibacter tunicatorum]